MQVSPRLVEWTKHRADIAVRAVDINRAGTQGIDWGSPVARQYGVSSVPFFVVVGPDGKLMEKGRAAYTDVLTAMSKDLED